MELTIDEGENAVFIGIKMTKEGIEASVFNMDFSSSDRRECSILALGAAASIINNIEDVEKMGIEEFVKFTEEIVPKSEEDEEDEEDKITRKDNVINISKILKDRKDK